MRRYCCGGAITHNTRSPEKGIGTMDKKKLTICKTHKGALVTSLALATHDPTSPGTFLKLVHNALHSKGANTGPVSTIGACEFQPVAWPKFAKTFSQKVRLLWFSAAHSRSACIWPSSMEQGSGSWNLRMGSEAKTNKQRTHHVYTRVSRSCAMSPYG